jgi:hypothetical protein
MCQCQIILPFRKPLPVKILFSFWDKHPLPFSLLCISNKKDAKMAAAHILQCLKIGSLLLAKIVLGVF